MAIAFPDRPPPDERSRLLRLWDELDPHDLAVLSDLVRRSHVR